MYYITFKELKRGGEDCEISKERPSSKYVRVISDSSANCGRGENRVMFKDIVLASEYQYKKFSPWQDELEGPYEPTIGLINDALRKAKEIGLIK